MHGLFKRVYLNIIFYQHVIDMINMHGDQHHDLFSQLDNPHTSQSGGMVWWDGLVIIVINKSTLYSSITELL